MHKDTVILVFTRGMGMVKSCIFTRLGVVWDGVYLFVFKMVGI